MFEIYDESNSAKEGACLRYVMNRQLNRCRRMRMLKIAGEPESPNEGGRVH